jgi:hypothetical protein
MVVDLIYSQNTYSDMYFTMQLAGRQSFSSNRSRHAAQGSARAEAFCGVAGM